MVIATSGGATIHYNRIISSSASPYSIKSAGSSTYQDPTTSVDREIRALFISSLTLAYSLIYDITYYRTELATIDFLLSKITYKRTLPRMTINDMTVGLFVSDTIYYVGSYSDKFYQG
jgi:hypothetical protein